MEQPPVQADWSEANQRYLTAALAMVGERLAHATDGSGDAEPPFKDLESELELAKDAMPAPAALENLCEAFDLSGFERDILLLCAGMELDEHFGAVCSAASSSRGASHPTFGLALAVLPDAHWSALSPDGSLRHWRLIEIVRGESLLTSRLRIDERILHYLAGIHCFDERLKGLARPLSYQCELAASHIRLAEQIAVTWGRSGGLGNTPIIQLCGEDVAVKQTIGLASCDALNLNLMAMPVRALPSDPNEFDAVLRLWTREAVLTQCALMLEDEESEGTEVSRDGILMRWTDRADCPLLISMRDHRPCSRRPAVALEVGRPLKEEQMGIWETTLGEQREALNGHISSIVAQFDFSVASIRSACAENLSATRDDEIRSGEDKESSPDPARRLWNACRRQSRPKLDGLAQRLDSCPDWSDLVLPERQHQALREISQHVKHRRRVYYEWGFAAKSGRGLGITALFSGASGTGKTLAAEALANALNLDLYKIDLSSVVSKYIGETERNLRKIFDGAEGGGVVLLFDEADALFGKRSEVKDSHDRYANIEVSYLLQRMESYQGLAILTTNIKESLDTAFLRRLRFVVQFPFPDLSQRTQIWQAIFPKDTPTEGLDAARLARLKVAGGNIRNIALNAAFAAADAEEPVRMEHVLHAARSEYAKLEKTLTGAEIDGWT